MDLQGQCIDDRYVLGALLGEGADAQVYYAMDRHLGRTVAIKLLRPTLCTDPTFVTRFEREARSAGRLNHPHIVPVYDYGEAMGTHYLVMEYVRGGDLRASLSRGEALPTQTAVRVAAEVAEALGAAHARGLVHRDVKPANILLTESGQAKVTDFGIAKMLAVPPLTPPSVLLGTPHYMAPEQAAGEAITPATDVYAVGVILFEMLAGRRPFAGDGLLQVAMQHLRQEAPPVDAFNPAVPPALVALVARALAKDPARRFADGGALAAALRALAPAEQTVITLKSYTIRLWEPPGSGRGEPAPSWAPPVHAAGRPAAEHAAGAGATAARDEPARRPRSGWGQGPVAEPPRRRADVSAWGQPAVAPAAPASPPPAWSLAPLADAALPAVARREPALVARPRVVQTAGARDPYSTVAVMAVCLGLLVGGLLSGRALLGGREETPPVAIAPAGPTEPSAAAEALAPVPTAVLRERPIVTLDPPAPAEPTVVPAQPAPPAPTPVVPDVAPPRGSVAVAVQPPPSAPPPAARSVPSAETRARSVPTTQTRARVVTPGAAASTDDEDDLGTAAEVEEVAPPAAAPSAEPGASPPAPPEPAAQPAAPRPDPPRRGYGPVPIPPVRPLPPIGMPPPFPMAWGPPLGPLPPRPGPALAMPPPVLLPLPAPPGSQQAAASNSYAARRP